MRAAAAAICFYCAAARGEEIRIEIARGLLQARIETRAGLQVVKGPAQFEGPLRLDGRELAGKLELIAASDGLIAVNTVDLEDYVAAVVASEVPPAWPQQALRAQAVAARTFAVAQKIAQGPGAQAHLRGSVLDQVYRTTARPPPSTLEAARATAGEVLTFGAAPIAAYFSASCGGVSESAEAAFHLASGSTPYLRGGVRDEDERAWKARIPLAEIAAALRKAGRAADVRSIKISSRTQSGRAQMLQMQTRSGWRPLLAVELRQMLGYSRLPSLLFDLAVEDGAAVFSGRGSGHGVGLCQWGAYARAKKGDDYRKILARYYPGAELRRMY